MLKTIERFYIEIQAKFNGTLQEMIASLVLSNLSERLLNDWDSILEWVNNHLDELEEKDEEEKSSDDCIKIASIYIILAIMYKLDEEKSFTEVIKS